MRTPLLRSASADVPCIHWCSFRDGIRRHAGTKQPLPKRPWSDSLSIHQGAREEGLQSCCTCCTRSSFTGTRTSISKARLKPPGRPATTFGCRFHSGYGFARLEPFNRRSWVCLLTGTRPSPRLHMPCAALYQSTTTDHHRPLRPTLASNARMRHMLLTSGSLRSAVRSFGFETAASCMQSAAESFNCITHLSTLEDNCESLGEPEI